jgi:P4 family phage/plasmid primase-like protien
MALEGAISYVPEIDRWRYWDGARWITDYTYRPAVLRACRRLQEHMQAEAVARLTALDGGTEGAPDQKPGYWAEITRKELRDSHPLVWQALHGLQALRKLENDQVWAGALDTCRANVSMHRPLLDWDPDTHLLGVPGATLDLHTGVARPPLRDDHITRATTVAPVAGPTPKWDALLERALPDPARRNLLVMALGYGLVGDNRLQKILMITGPTGAGKSTIVDTVTRIIGKGYCSTFGVSLFSEDATDKPRPDMLDLMLARLAICHEPGTAWAIQAAALKRLSGGRDEVKARQLYSGEFVEYPISFMPVFVANVLPQIENMDSAVMRRILPIVCSGPTVGTPENPHLSDEIVAEEGPAILATLIAAGVYVAAHPEVLSLASYPACVASDLAALRTGMSEIGVWYVDAVTHTADGGHFTGNAALYEAYSAWCLANGVHTRDVLDSRKFGAELSALTGTKPTQQRAGGARVWGRRGVLLAGAS